jgi:hypothetical protein
MSSLQFALIPAAALAAAESLYKLYNSIQEARQRRQMLALLKEISDKLDTVISRQDEILLELRDLRVKFRFDVRKEFIYALEVSLGSYRSQLNIKAASIGHQPAKASLAEISTLADPVEKLSFDLLGYGPAGFTGAMATALLLHSIFGLQRELGAAVSKVDIREMAYLREWERAFAHWYDAANADGLAFALTALGAARVKLHQEIDGHTRRVDLDWYNTGRTVDQDADRCEVWGLRTLVISGDIKTGFSDSYETARTANRNCRYRRGDDGPRGDRGGGGGSKLSHLGEEQFWLDLPEDARWMAGYDPEDPYNIPTNLLNAPSEESETLYLKASEIAFGKASKQLIPVNHPITQALQAKREEWLALVAQEAKLRTFSEFVEKTRAEFAARALQLGR